MTTPTGTTVVVNSDNIEGKSKDKARIQRCVDALKNAGYNAITSGIGPNWHVTDMKTHKNSYIVCIVGGLCAGTIADYGAKYYQNYMENNNNTGGQALFWKHSKYKCNLDEIDFLEKAWDDNFSGSSFKGITKPATYLQEHNFDYCGAGEEDTFVQAVVNMVKTGSHTSSSVSLTTDSTATVSSGFTAAGKGTTPQFWNLEYYDEPLEIPFTDFEISDENPRILTASFTSTTKLDLTEGDAIFITGDCTDFGGILLKKSYDSENRLWDYECQGFMDRIMANPIYYVADGTKTNHTIITEVLADMGLPTTCLLPADEYDTAVTEETTSYMELDSDLTETSEQFTSQEQNTTSSGENSDDDSETKTYTKTLSSTKDNKARNPFKAKAVGIYDSDTTGDFIRTLIFDYGINVDFYGDVNGIPHFDILQLETWKNSGWIISPKRGFEENFDYTFDTTNILTQVGIKNISAINGNGEIYTSQELLGVNLEDYVIRMGTILDNPSTKGSYNQEDNGSEEQIKEQYQDSTGKQYSIDKSITTNGKPSCSKCAETNGGLQPSYEIYTKSWLNQCPGCKSDNTLTNDTRNDGTTLCTKCKLEYCQYCGYERKHGNYQLLELFQTNTQASDETIQKNNRTSD